MLIFDFQIIGAKLLLKRKALDMTQSQVAEASGLADRTYADIERGTVNMRTETLLKICQTLHITPNDILTEEDSEIGAYQDELLERLAGCSRKEKETALGLLTVYLESLEQ